VKLISLAKRQNEVGSADKSGIDCHQVLTKLLGVPHSAEATAGSPRRQGIQLFVGGRSRRGRSGVAPRTKLYRDFPIEGSHGALVHMAGSRGDRMAFPLVLIIPMPHKHNADRRHHIPKMLFKVQNWPAYEAGRN
jgi:hypothetical protein